MSKLLNQRTAIRLLHADGWRVARGGKHVVKMVRDGRAVTLPRHRGQDYGKRLTHQILKQAGLDSMEGKEWNSRSSYIRSEMASGRRPTSYRDASHQAEL